MRYEKHCSAETFPDNIPKAKIDSKCKTPQETGFNWVLSS